ncbi:MAG: hypothetical protein ACAI35_03850 [Candidatus Methylacidiphilales bacterium]
MKNGTKIKTQVGSMQAKLPKGWPMLPEHDSTLSLDLVGMHLIANAKDIEVSGIAHGLGISAPSDDDETCHNEMFNEPCFWSAHYHEHMADEEGESDTDTLIPQFFGHDSDEPNQFYVDNLRSGCPLFSKELPNGLSVQVVYSDVAEYQTRYSLRLPDGEKILLGYESAHFSLPAMRWEELVHIRNAHASISTARSAAECLLLLFPSVYILAGDPVEEIRLALCQAWEELGIVQAGQIKNLTESIIRSHVYGEIQWKRHETFGWINTSMYSQRNPESRLSQMSQGGWAKLASCLDSLA